MGKRKWSVCGSVPWDNIANLCVKNLFTSTQGAAQRGRIKAPQWFVSVSNVIWRICSYVYMVVANDDTHQRPSQCPNPANYAKPSVACLLSKSFVIFHSRSFSLCSWYATFSLVNGYLMKSWPWWRFTHNTSVDVIKATWIWWDY